MNDRPLHPESRVADRKTNGKQQRISHPGHSNQTGSPQHGRWSRLCVKELRETLRDRRTLITLILMPLLVYPVLSMVFQRSLLTSISPEAPKVVVGVRSMETAEIVRRSLTDAEAYLEQQPAVTDRPAIVVERQRLEGDASLSPDATKPAAVPDPLQPVEGLSEIPIFPQIPEIAQETSVEQVVFREVEDCVDAVQAEEIDLAVLLPTESKSKQFELIYRQGSVLSNNALEYIEKRLLVMNEVVLRQRLFQLGQQNQRPYVIVRQPIAAKSRSSVLSTIVPMILILMTVTGAVYPAIDLTAGERERGTLEMLMASPVSRFRLLLAKYTAVVTVAFLTALVNLTAMTVTLWATGLSQALLGEAGLGPVRVLQILALLVLFAAFFSAVLLSLTSFAKSFKEAQAYLIPLMLLSLGPGIVSLLPGLELNGLLAITPISNMVLLARDLCGDAVNPAMAVVAILSTALYTLAALAIAAKIFGTDAVMSGSNASFQMLLRDDSQPWGAVGPRVSTVGGALLCLAVLFPMYFLCVNGLSKFATDWDWSLTTRLVASGVTTCFLFGVLPWAAATMQRLDLQPTFQTFPARFGSFTVALLLGFTVWPLAHEAVLLMQNWELALLSPDKLKAAAAMLERLQTVHPAVILLCLAIAPAIFEEVFFRGYLFSALKVRTSARNTILISAILFGLFHVVSANALSLERMLPSTMMGFILGWLCYRSESILPGIVLHACHNGLLTMLAHYQKRLEAAGWGMDEQSHLPANILVASVACLVVGIALIAWLPKNRYAV